VTGRRYLGEEITLPTIISKSSERADGVSEHLLSEPEVGTAPIPELEPDRAQTTEVKHSIGGGRTAQQISPLVGNQTVLRMLGQSPAPPTNPPKVQRPPQQPTTPLQDVEAVRSLHIELLKGSVSGSEAALERRIRQRRTTIQSDLRTVSKIKDQPWATQKVTALEGDLKKEPAEILKVMDSKYVNPKLRQDIVTAAEAVSKKRVALQSGEKRWRQYDAVFADPAVVKTLAARHFSPADLKALVAQESGDLTKHDTKGDIAGVAQMSTEAIKEVGGRPEDRLDPNKAIPLAAKVLIQKARQLEAELDQIPQGPDYKKFVFASYNAGARTIVLAQMKAKAMRRDPASWDALVEGGSNSPLYHGITAALPKADPLKKYRETTHYVADIALRLP